MNETMNADVPDVTIPLPATSGLAGELAASRHIGAARFGIAVRLDETLQVTDVLVPLSASGLTGPEIGHELTVALERARVKATASLRARLLADPEVAAALTPSGPVEEPPAPESRATAYVSDDGVATVYRVEGGPVTSVVLAVGEYFSVGELTEPVRQAATRALTDAGWSEQLDRKLARFDAAMAQVERTLTDLDRRLDAALAD